MYHFIINRNSSSGKGRQIWSLLEAKLEKENVSYQAHFTKYKGHASELSAHLTQGESSVTIIAVGGDGTANEVINGMRRFSKVTFGYIPTGSSNDLARGLGLASDPEDALEQILHPACLIPLSIGENTAGEEHRRFIVSTGIGFDAAVCHEALHSRLKKALNKFHLGKLTYTGIALKQMLLLKPVSMNLTLDDGKKKHFPGVFFIAAMNLKYEGGGFMFCPDADPTDQFLDLCVIEKMPKLKALLLLPTAFKGKHTRRKGVHIYRCQKAHIQSGSSLAVHTDGEAFGFRSDITLTLHDAPLQMIGQLNPKNFLVTR